MQWLPYVNMSVLQEHKNNDTVKSNPKARKISLDIISKARADGRDSLTEIEAKGVFKAYGLPVTVSELAKTEDEAVALGKKIGFPLVLKIVSPDILHKSDAGGVKVNIKDEAGIRDAFKTIMANAKAYKADANIHGVCRTGNGTLGNRNDPWLCQ